jgi:DNA end-binding protein Ku
MTIRATATGTLSFGLVAIPVKIYLGASAEDIHFNGLSPAGNRTGQKIIDKVTGDDVEKSDVTKGYEFSRGQYVKFSADEIAALADASGNKSVSIEEFVPLDTVDHRHVEKTYYLGADKGGDKPYQLLAETLEAKGRCAVAQWGTKGKTQLVLVRPWRTDKNLGLVMHQLFYADEVRDVDEVFDLVANIPAHEVERELASQVVDKLSKPAFDASQYQDIYRKKVLAAVDQKVAGKEVTVAAEAPKATVIDMIAALKQSLVDNKVPGAEAVAAKPKAAPKKARKPRKRKAG